MTEDLKFIYDVAFLVAGTAQGRLATNDASRDELNAVFSVFVKGLRCAGTSGSDQWSPSWLRSIERHLRYLCDISDGYETALQMWTQRGVGLPSPTSHPHRLGAEEEIRITTEAVHNLRRLGREEGRGELLLLMLRRRFGDINASLVDRVHAADIEDIDRWTDRFVNATDLSDVFDEV